MNWNKPTTWLDFSSQKNRSCLCFKTQNNSRVNKLLFKMSSCNQITTATQKGQKIFVLLLQ